jgi:CubicO group peptidase (beta-lactamase class C family)
MRVSALLLALAVLLGGCGGAGTVAAPSAHPSLAAAQREGFDSGRLRAAERRFEMTHGLGSVLVQRHGRLVFERYYHGASAGKPRNVFSVTKSVVSALVGIALRDGQLRSLDQKLVALLPKDFASTADPQVRTITLRDLLTMTAGYRETPIIFTDDWVRTLLNRPIVSEPGTKFSYDSGSAHLLAAALAQAVGMPLEVFADRELFGPVGIRPGSWSKDGQGRSIGSTGLSLSSRGLLRLGELYLRKGRWHGRQVVPAAWVRESTRKQVAIPGGYAYGYLWWVNAGPLSTGSHEGFLAQGYAGQMVAVFPRLDLVIVMTGGGDYDRIEFLKLLLAAVD